MGKVRINGNDSDTVLRTSELLLEAIEKYREKH